MFKLNYLSNYYQILEVTENATLQEIKAAYKRMAKMYHPDINSGAEAEETFKIVSLAYQVLSNPLTRSTYDSRLSQARLAQARSYAENRTYQTNHPFGYGNPYRRPQNYRYQPQRTYADKETEKKATFYAVAMIACITIVVYAAVSLVNYYREHAQQQLIERFDQQVAQADSLFYAGKDKAALLFINDLRDNARQNSGLRSYEYDYLNFRLTQAEIDFSNEAYKDASWGFLFYMEYTQRQNMDMLYKLAICYRKMRQFDQAVFILNELLNENYRRLYTISLMAEIYLHDLGNVSVALQYYEMGLENIERQFKSTYGKAYRLLVSAEKTPPIYKKIYFESAKIYFEAMQYEKARKLLEWVIFFNPEKKEGYEYLHQTYARMGKANKACAVLKKAKKNKVKLSVELNCNA